VFLATTSSVLRLITSSTANIDVTCNWVETNTGGQTPGQQLVTISSATTTTILAAPASGTVRRAVGLYVVNRHASVANTVTLQVFDGTTAFKIFEVSLSAGWVLFVGEDGRPAVFDANGRALSNDQLGNLAPTVNTLNVVVLASDVTNNNATANTIADVTGLSFSVNAAETYWFQFNIFYTSASGTTGSRWSIQGPASPTLLSYRSAYTLTTTTETLNVGLSAYDLPAASNATSLATANFSTVEGFIRPSASGTVIARFASEVSSSAIVAKAGSVCRWVRTL